MSQCQQPITGLNKEHASGNGQHRQAVVGKYLTTIWSKRGILAFEAASAFMAGNSLTIKESPSEREKQTEKLKEGKSCSLQLTLLTSKVSFSFSHS